MKPASVSSRNGHRHRRRFGRSQQDHRLDSYRWNAKTRSPTLCSQCGAVYSDGRWHWSPRPEGAAEAICQACHRINDNFPAGILNLHGSTVQAHKTEILGLARHQEQAEKPEHPLNRIMAIEEAEGGLTILTTDIHLPRRIAEALRRAFRGTLKVHYDDADYFVRVDWLAPK